MALADYHHQEAHRFPAVSPRQDEKARLQAELAELREETLGFHRQLQATRDPIERAVITASLHTHLEHFDAVEAQFKQIVLECIAEAEITPLRLV